MIKKVTYEPTNTEYDQVICDVTNTILRDHVALYPGYIEVKEGITTIHFSDDPDNNIRIGHPDYQVFIEQRQGVRNKIAFERVNVVSTLPGAPDGHYISEEVLGKALEKAQIKAEQEAPIVEPNKTETILPGEVNADDLPNCEMCVANAKNGATEGMTHAFMTKEHPYLDPKDQVTQPVIDNSEEIG